MSDTDTIREALDWVLNGQSVSPPAYERLNDALAALARLEAERDALSAEADGLRAQLYTDERIHERMVAAEEQSRLQAEALSELVNAADPLCGKLEVIPGRVRLPPEFYPAALPAIQVLREAVSIARAALALSEPSRSSITPTCPKCEGYDYRTEHRVDCPRRTASSVETPEGTTE